jgi:hypothetical protein
MRYIFLFFLICSLGLSAQTVERFTLKGFFASLAENQIEGNRHLLSFSASQNRFPLILTYPTILMEGDVYNRNRHGINAVDALYINYQYTLDPSFYLEAGYKFQLYYFGYYSDWYLGIGGEDLSTYNVNSFDLGGGYRFKAENGLRLFDVQAGLNVGIASQPRGYVWSDENTRNYVDWSGNQGVFDVRLEYEMMHRVNLGWYLGLSKDIRVTENLFLTARYHRYFDVGRNFSRHTINYSISTLGVQHETYGRMSTRGETFALGLKWLFDKKASK